MRKIALTALACGMLATGTTVLSASPAAAQDDSTTVRIRSVVLSHSGQFITHLKVQENGKWETLESDSWPPQLTVTDKGKLSKAERKELFRLVNQIVVDTPGGEGLDTCELAYSLYIDTSIGADTVQGCFDADRIHENTPSFNGAVRLLLSATSYR